MMTIEMNMKMKTARVRAAEIILKAIDAIEERMALLPSGTKEFPMSASAIMGHQSLNWGQFEALLQTLGKETGLKIQLISDGNSTWGTMLYKIVVVSEKKFYDFIELKKAEISVKNLSRELEEKSTSDHIIMYKDTVTNLLKNKLYYKESEERFSDGPSRRMWSLFARNPGEKHSLKDIFEKVRKGKTYEGLKHLREILMGDRKNMIKKISSIGIQRKEVNSWLIADKNKISERWGLEPEKGSIR